MSIFTTLSAEIVSQATRVLTGQLFTEEQVKKITSHSVGKYLKELFPNNELERTQRERIELAQSHIEEASSIMADMRTELDSQKKTLDHLLGEIEEKKSMAEKYAQLAETNQGAVLAVRQEIETALREELVRQSTAGRGTRRVASALL
jgi:pyrroloquinoline quinone (PQQ) biosynthesis protein C